MGNIANTAEKAKHTPGRLRWRKDRKQGSFLSESHSFTDGVTPWFVKVQECESGWFWYGMGANSAGAPSPSLELAKRDAEAHARAAIARATGATP